MLTGIQSNKNRGNTHFVTILNRFVVAYNPGCLYLFCFFRLQRYYPIVVDRFMSQLLFLIPQLYGSSKVECFDCILARADQYPDVFRELRAKNIQSLMRSR